MKKSIKVEFHSIRNINDFCSLNRCYSKRVRISSGSSKDEISGLNVINVGSCVEVLAEGSEDAVVELFDSYRLFGIA